MTSDLTKHEPELRSTLTGTFSGTIGNRESTQEGAVPCEHAGETFTLTIAATKVEDCSGTEDEQDVPCTHAGSGSVALSGALSVGNDEPQPLTGFITIKGCSRGTPLYFHPEIDDAVYPSAGLSAEPEIQVLGDTFDSFTWERRHTKANEEPIVWESCELTITSRSK